ncbi:MAG: hypothetical protein LBP59_05895, partial [Planctomycetaceae bacterium]|nr:hypothetical protein [Planctomycetaceae bacterium]
MSKPLKKSKTNLSKKSNVSLSSRSFRFFNTTGPCNPVQHYMLHPAERLRGAQLDRYIRDDLYW